MAELSTDAKLAFESGSPPAWVPITGITSLQPPQGSAARVDVTAYGASAMQYQAGLTDYEACRATAWFAGSTGGWFEVLNAAKESRTALNWRLELPVGSQYRGMEWSGQIARLSPRLGGPNDPIAVEIEIYVGTGGITVDAAPGSSEIG